MFSRRLDWETEENALAPIERRLRAAGGPFFDLTVSNPTTVGLPDRSRRLAALLGQTAVGTYHPSPFGLEEARAAVVKRYAQHDAPLTVPRVCLTASSSESYSLLFKLLCDPGDIVLVPEPSYPLFDFLARLEGVVVRRYRLAWDGEWHIDWPSVDFTGARAIVVVNPNNPTGSFLRKAELDRLNARAAESDVALIADEVFNDYPLDPPDDAVFTVAAHPARPLTFALGGLSKGAGLPQLKLGWIATCGPPDQVAAALTRLELLADTYLSVGTPVMAALPDLLEEGAEIRADIQARLHDNRMLVERLIGRGSPCNALPVEGGWSQILRLPATEPEEEWTRQFLEEDRVLVQPGYFFDLVGVGTTIVVSLLTPPEILAEGLTRLIRRVNDQLTL